MQGVPGDQVVAATKDYPFILPGDQLYWLGSTLHDPDSRIVQAYVQTGKFLVDQGRLSSAPSAAQIAAARRHHVHQEGAGRCLLRANMHELTPRGRRT